MILRQIVRALLKRTVPVMYAISFTLKNHSESKRPTIDDKLNLEPPDIKKLTVEYMIQQSILDSINNATQTLNIAYMAVMRTSNEYKTLLNSLISLTRDTIEFHVRDEHWDLIVELRSKVQTKKEQLNKLTGYVQYVQRMAVAASDLSYISGMDNLNFSLSKQIDDVLKSIQEEVEIIAILEQEYYNIQEQCIRNSTNSDNNESIK